MECSLQWRRTPFFPVGNCQKFHTGNPPPPTFWQCFLPTCWGLNVDCIVRTASHLCHPVPGTKPHTVSALRKPEQRSQHLQHISNDVQCQRQMRKQSTFVHLLFALSVPRTYIYRAVTFRHLLNHWLEIASPHGLHLEKGSNLYIHMAHTAAEGKQWTASTQGTLASRPMPCLSPLARTARGSICCSDAMPSWPHILWGRSAGRKGSPRPRSDHSDKR